MVMEPALELAELLAVDVAPLSLRARVEHQDSRTPGNRRAEALVGLVVDGAGAESNPRRREPLFTVLVDHETFLSGTLHPDSVLETVDGTVIGQTSG